MSVVMDENGLGVGGERGVRDHNVDLYNFDFFGPRA